MADYNKLWEDMQGLLGNALLAPARGMMAQSPEADFGQGLLGQFFTKAHKAIDPVNALGGYGNMAAMALPPGAPKGKMPRMSKIDVDLYHGSPTLSRGADWNPKMQSVAPRTDPGYMGRGMYFTPQEWIAKHYAKPPKGGMGGAVIKGKAKPGRYLDIIYDEHYIQNLEAAAKKLGVNKKFLEPGWADDFGKAARKAGYDGARGLNADGTIAEVVIYDPKKMMQFD